MKSNSLVWNVKGWFKSSTFECYMFVSFFNLISEIITRVTYTYLKPQICRGFVRHHMRADIDSDNLTLAVRITRPQYLS